MEEYKTLPLRQFEKIISGLALYLFIDKGRSSPNVLIPIVFTFDN